MPGASPFRWSFVPVAASAVVLCYGLTIAAFSLRGFPDQLHHGRSMPYLSDKPLGEDAFYMMTMGWNLGSGQGLSYGGQPTTGTQPLMTVLYGGLAVVVRAAGGDKWAFARTVLAFNAVLFVAFALITTSLARSLMPSGDRAVVAAVATVLTVTNYALFRMFTYGLETGLYLIVGGLCILASTRLSGSHRTLLGILGLGASAGAAALARIDFLVVFAVFLAIACLRRQLAFRDGAIAAFVAGAVASPWLLWVHHMTGGWMPTSGQSQMAAITTTSAPERLLALAWALASHASPWLYPELARSAATRVAPGLDELWKAAVAAVLIAVSLAVAIRAKRAVPLASWHAMTTWFLAVAALASVYVVFFWPTYFYTRYTALLALVTIPVLTAGIAAIAGTRLPAFAVLGGGLALFLVTAGLTLHRGEAGDSYSITARFIDTQVPPTERIGAFSSGVFGYFFENVVNLDGKVNAAAMSARREGQLGSYMNGAGLTLLLDWPATIRTFVADAYLEQCWVTCPTALLPEQGSCFRRQACPAGIW